LIFVMQSARSVPRLSAMQIWVAAQRFPLTRNQF
jgi:hypothetical protein